MFSSIDLVEPGLRVDVLGEDLAVGGGEQDVVERQALAELVFDHGDPWAAIRGGSIADDGCSRTAATPPPRDRQA